MSKHRALVYGATIPQSFLDALQEFMSTYLSPNAVATVLSGNTVQVSAGTVNDQVGVGIMGRWRYNTAAVTATHPGGAAGNYNLWAVAADNNFTIGPPEVDNTVYTFTLSIQPIGSTPAGALTRIVGTVVWNGSSIMSVGLLPDDPATRGPLLPGDIIVSAASTRVGALLCDGTAVSRTTYAALFNAIGTTYGAGNGSTTFNVPNYVGRTIIGVGAGAGLTSRAAGASGGAETVTLAATESGVAAHTHTGATVTGTTGTGSTGTGSSGTGTATPGSNPVSSGGASARHTHPQGLASAGVAIDATAGTTYGMVQSGSTGNDTPDHSHSVTLPNYAVPALSVPALSIPSLSVSGTTGTIPAASATAAASGHANMQPWASGYIFVKV